MYRVSRSTSLSSSLVKKSSLRGRLFLRSLIWGKRDIIMVNWNSLQPNVVDLRYFKLWNLSLKFQRFTPSGCKERLEHLSLWQQFFIPCIFENTDLVDKLYYLLEFQRFPCSTFWSFLIRQYSKYIGLESIFYISIYRLRKRMEYQEIHRYLEFDLKN